MFRHFMLVEAVNSVAIEHASSCTCLACRAANGDQDAWTELYLALAEREDAIRADGSVG
jgi:hypothetical protein